MSPAALSLHTEKDEHSHANIPAFGRVWSQCSCPSFAAMTHDTLSSLHYLGICYYVKYLPSPVMLIFPDFQVFQEFSALLPLGCWVFLILPSVTGRSHRSTVRSSLVLIWLCLAVLRRTEIVAWKCGHPWVDRWWLLPGKEQSFFWMFKYQEWYEALMETSHVMYISPQPMQ